MGQHSCRSLEVSHLELLRRASTYGDPQAWKAFQQSLEETVFAWFHEHPYCEAACRVHCERYFVSQAFGRLRQGVVQKQIAGEMLSDVLAYLRASLNGAILETLRTCSRPGTDSEFGSAEQNLHYATHGLEVWIWVQTKLFNEREQRLVYLLYHCGLEPDEIVRSYPQEWGDVQEVVSFRRSILTRLIQ